MADSPDRLTQRLHRVIDAVRQEPQRRDQDQRERQGPDEQTEREPSGQEPTRATLVAVVRVEQDVDPVAPLALLTDPDLGLTPGFHGPVARVARPVAQPPFVSLVAEVVGHGTTIVPPVGCSLAAVRRRMGAGTVTFSEIMEKVTRGFETVGVAILVIGIAVAFIRAVLDLRREDAHRAYSRLRQDMGRSILLGLEVLIAADLVRTVTIDPTLESAIFLGVIVLVRTFLSFSLEIELDGVVPWRKRSTAPEE